MVLKCVAVVVFLLVSCGCVGMESDHARDREGDMMNEISVSSDAFEDDGMIPAEYTCDGENVSPQISWTGIPAGSKSIVLIVDDPDAPGGTFTHWVVYNIPPDVVELPRGVERQGALPSGCVRGVTDFGSIGYGGPCPPPGKPHRYHFKVYALDEKLSLGGGSTKDEVEAAMEGHVLAMGELVGRYGR
ncbi:Phosphatidylethanolamine-binding protein [Candidatus Methanoperedenaceae archaeon GB50]|nr:Phosphatidylethanolamine-binding protein [Candidatus Methanoperedenaceae archaeon GB37]CAD7775929.1 Phosphatidylethanolamine-binding protein [Candidatus Methanoperedenaceae archaeon GB50]CAD7780205.1 MAG: Phosphatidylethanolamine-binding protein [Candidatus Methanoperedenaceae archaeon GB50]